MRNLIVAAGLVLGFAGSLTAQDKPHGEHYNLNIIGKAKTQAGMTDTTSGHVIFVSLGSTTGAVATKIMLSPSDSFRVLDKNGTDGTAAFALPLGGYTVWARTLGKPGGSVDLSTCASDSLANRYCSTTHEVLVRTVKGKGKGKKAVGNNVTAALTTLSLDPVADSLAVAGCGSSEVSLFNPCLEGYLWNVNNSGLRLLQLRFYPIGAAPVDTTPPAPVDTAPPAPVDTVSVR